MSNPAAPGNRTNSNPDGPAATTLPRSTDSGTTPPSTASSSDPSALGNKSSIASSAVGSAGSQITDIGRSFWNQSATRSNGNAETAANEWRATNLKSNGGKTKAISNKDPRVLTCENWMTREVVTAAPRDSIGNARELLQQHRINQLPIIEGGVLVGIATDRDLRTKEYVPQSAHEILLEAVMSRHVLTMGPLDTVIDAAALLRRRRIGSLPIVDGGRLAGILTRSDILEAFMAREQRDSGSATAGE
jgi:CBS domain-containing protein